MRDLLIHSLAAASIVAFDGSDLLAQDRQPDAVVVTAWAAEPSGSNIGGGGGAEWLRSIGTGSGIQLGGQSGSLAGSWWGWGRVGGFTRRGTFVFTGTADVGGVNTGTTVPYWRYSAGASKVLPSAIVFDTEFQQFKLAVEEQRLFKAGASFPIAKALELKGSYFLIVANQARTPAVSGRVDVLINKQRILMGTVLSRSEIAQPLIGNAGTVIRTSQEFFAGFSTPVRSSSLVVSANLMRSDSSRLVRVEMGLRVPIERKRSLR